MRITKEQLRRVIREAVRARLAETVPPHGTSMQTRTTAAAAAEHPAIQEAIDVMIGAVAEALEEMMGDPEAAMNMEESLHTEFHNDLMKFVEDWMNTYTEAHARGELS